MRGYFSNHQITRTQSQKLYGTARWVVCPIFGRVGLSLLTPLRNLRRPTPLVAGEQLFESLKSLYLALPLIPPVEFPLYRRSDHAVIVLSDASWSKGGGEMGLVVWCPYQQKLYFASLLVPKPVVRHWRSLREQDTYIHAAELLACAAVYYTLPEILKGRLVHHFIDNEAARANAISGSTGSLLTASILGTYHVQILALACQPWVGFVYSEDNLADLPSRGDFRLVRRMGGIFVRNHMQLPNIVSDELDLGPLL